MLHSSKSAGNEWLMIPTHGTAARKSRSDARRFLTHLCLFITLLNPNTNSCSHRKASTDPRWIGSRCYFHDGFSWLLLPLALEYLKPAAPRSDPWVQYFPHIQILSPNNLCCKLSIPLALPITASAEKKEGALHGTGPCSESRGRICLFNSRQQHQMVHIMASTAPHPSLPLKWPTVRSMSQHWMWDLPQRAVSQRSQAPLWAKKNALNNLLPWMNSSPGGMSKGFGVQVPTPAMLSTGRKCWVGLERHLVRSPCSKAGV